MDSLQEYQNRVKKLLEAAEPKENLKPWVKGFIPKNYKRLSISMDEAKELAILGASKGIACFNHKYYFTQALLMGAVVSGRYTKIITVTPSQYGKSWTCGDIGIVLGDEGRKVYVTGGDANTSEIILNKTMENIQDADNEIKSKLMEPADKLEKLQTSLSKKKISWVGGGTVEGLSLGETYKNAKQGNKAIGRGGDYIIDEASMISDDTYAELGRREFASDDGEEFISLEISNPHNPGRFWDMLISDKVPKKTLIVWMDIRTAYEEGRVKSIEQVVESDFYKNKSTCKRYLICELEDYSEDSMFGEPIIDDSKLTEDATFYLGIDSAYKGKDGIEAVLTVLDENAKVRVFENFNLKRDEWIDGMTSVEIINDILNIIDVYKVKMVCIDIGAGIWLVEGLSQHAEGFIVKGINFGSATTKFRREARHYSAVYGFNMRAELHMDVEDLMDNRRLSFTSDMYAVLKDQMNAVKAMKKGQGAKTMIIPKDDMKAVIGKSPDELDATVLSIHAVLLYSMMQGTFLYQDE